MATGDITFALRGDTIAAYRSFSGKTPGKLSGNEAAISDVTAIGGFAIDMTTDNGSLGNRHALFFNGQNNLPTTQAFSILIRFKIQNTIAQLISLWGFGLPTAAQIHRYLLYWNNSAAEIRTAMYNDNAQIYQNNVGGSWNPTTTSWYDVVLTCSGQATVGAVNIYVDGSSIYTSGAPSVSLESPRTNYRDTYLSPGYSDGINSSDLLVNEFVVFEGVIDPTNVPLANTTSGSLNGSSRTSFVDATAFDGLSSTDPGIANVKNGIGYTIDGTSYTGSLISTDPGIANVLSGTSYIIESTTYTGSYHDATYTDPGIANVLSGTSYIFNDTTQTGTLVSGTYTDPGIANVRQSTSYIFNSSTLTGTLSVPTPVDGTAGTVNIGNIKEQIRYILDTNNTNTSSVLDLSSSMSKRVLQVAKINPENIMMQSTKFPAVTIHTSKKTIENTTISKDQVSGKRKSVITFTVTGLVWNQNFQSNIFNDPADQDLEFLMENVERILRSYHDLNSNVTWQISTDVTYHNAPFDEQTHFRVGFLDIEATVYY